MKRYIIFSIVILFLFSSTSNSFSFQHKKINVRVDPRLELLSIVQYLSGYDKAKALLTKLDFEYKKDIEKHFSKYKTHAAVKIFENIGVNGSFDYSAPPTAMLHLSSPPDLEIQVPVTDVILKRAGGKKNMDQFITELRDFAIESNFMDFYNRHISLYEIIQNDVKRKLEGVNTIEALEKYFGIKNHSYNILVVPLFHGGGYGPRVKRSDGKLDVFYIGGPRKVENDTPVFGTKESFMHIAWHEFCHSFVNPTTERFTTEIHKSKSLLTPILLYMNRIGYADWETAVNEHLVRAVTARLQYLNLGEDDKATIKKEKEYGFFYIDHVYKKILDYEKNRDKYSNFIEFYPEILKIFNELTRKDLDEDFFVLPYTGNAISILSQNNKVVILPTNEKDKKLQQKIHESTKLMYDKFHSGTTYINDSDALETDLSDSFLIVFGTMEGNLWLRKHSELFPFKLSGNKLTADKEYTGNRLRLITTFPNPENPEKGVLIYTANNLRDVRSAGGVFHGPTDYVIVNGWKILKAGNYNKNTGKWRF